MEPTNVKNAEWWLQKQDTTLIYHLAISAFAVSATTKGKKSAKDSNQKKKLRILIKGLVFQLVLCYDSDMENTTATKTKKTKIDSLRPPREIQDITKERRAWLAARVAEINALPNREAKIVGEGSYQTVTVYQLEEVKGRVQLRGHCQFCGNEQAIKGGVLVLHGYKRPGDGQTWGRCPGVDLKPLNEDKSQTEKWLEQGKVDLEAANAKLVEAEATKNQASQVYWAQTEVERGDALKAMPKKPTPTYQNGYRKPSYQDMLSYEAALTTWGETFTVAFAHVRAGREYEKARQIVWNAKSSVDHFTTLLEMNLFGKPLREEVVA